MNKQKITIKNIVAVTFIIVILFPLLLNELIFDNNYLSKVSNDGWAGFLGSYIGGMIGGFGTLIAVYITVRQNQKQIEDEKNKEKKKKHVDEANEIATLVAKYLSDLQIYIAQEKDCDDSIKKASYFEYYELLRRFKMERNKRHSGGFRTYIEELERDKFSTEYPRRFLHSYEGDNYNEEKKFDDYEKGLEEIISRNKEKIDIISCTKSEAKQRYVLGNNSYMLLDIKLSNMEFADDLKTALGNLHAIMTENNIIKLPTILNKSSNGEVDDAISKVMQEIRIFVIKYVE